MVIYRKKAISRRWSLSNKFAISSQQKGLGQQKKYQLVKLLQMSEINLWTDGLFCVRKDHQAVVQSSNIYIWQTTKYETKKKSFVYIYN